MSNIGPTDTGEATLTELMLTLFSIQWTWAYTYSPCQTTIFHHRPLPRQFGQRQLQQEDNTPLTSPCQPLIGLQGLLSWPASADLGCETRHYLHRHSQSGPVCTHRRERLLCMHDSEQCKQYQWYQCFFGMFRWRLIFSNLVLVCACLRLRNRWRWSMSFFCREAHQTHKRRKLPFINAADMHWIKHQTTAISSRLVCNREITLVTPSMSKS